MIPFSTRHATSVLLLGASTLVACSSDNPGTGTGPAPCSGSACAAVISSDITTDRTLHADTVYTLSGFIHVANGATLTIEPGTKIVGDYEVPGSSLFVLRGAKIRAVGTAEKPIVFTSERPVGQRAPGDWGGLIIVGNGIVNRGSPTILEGSGTGAANPEVNYAGGTNNADDSGILQYVRVEFAGYATAADAELNSFTFAAVGNGTTVDHLQTMAGLDDSFEFFGGAVDGKYLLSYESGDDHFDMSEGYQGRLQYLVAFQSQRLDPRPAAGSYSSDPQGIENDGCAGQNCLAGQNSQPYTIPVVANYTLVGTGPGVVDGTSGGIGAVLRRGTGGHYVNGVITRWPAGALSIRDAETSARIAAGDLTVRNQYLADNGKVFHQGTLDLVANDIEVAAAGVTAASLFTKLPATTSAATTAADFDWSLKAGIAPATGGLTTFAGQLAARAGGFVQPTTFRGAADATGAKWWSGWSVYAIR